MKTVKLIGTPLVIARSISEVLTHHRALHDAWEEKVNREKELLFSNCNAEMAKLLQALAVATGLEMGEAKLDLRYIDDHDVAFVVFEEDGDDAELPAAPGEH
jgi:hypothetical protein